MNEMSYGQYLKIDQLLKLQQLKSNPEEHDEHLFIVIHQSYELWFKQILFEIDFIKRSLVKKNLIRGLKTLSRVLTILKVIVAKIDILETITPLDFKSFRNALKNSSGFQSVQFRKLELVLGLNHKSALKNNALSEVERNELKIFSKKATIWETVIVFLQKNYDDRIETPKRIETDGLIFKPNSNTQQLIYQLILSHPDIAFLMEKLIDLDEALQEWRYRHVKMVERTIGNLKGTGGSKGVEYLKSTLHRQVFPDLWAIRSLF